MLLSAEFPFIRRTFRLPLSLNGQVLPGGFLTGGLEVVELFRPVWGVANESWAHPGAPSSHS